MSSIAPSARLGWRLLPAVMAAAIAVMAASLLIATLRDNPMVVAGRDASALGADVAEAAVWRTDAFPVGASGELSRKESRRFTRQKERVRATVRDLADALAVQPGRLPDAVDRLVTKVAAASLLKRAPEIPNGSEAVTVVKRTGRIGIQAPRFAAAAAELRVVMEATIDDRLVKWRDEYRFWLERVDGRWSVIAFDLERAQR